MMNDCYQKNYMRYDWLIFYEIDEFIYLKNINNIKIYLGSPNFTNCESINLNWILHTDNNLLDYENKPLKERFPEKENVIEFKAIKSILKGHIPNITINCVHTLNGNLKICDGFGRPRNFTGIGTTDIDDKFFYIDHYASKSTKEFIDKMNKGDVLYMKDNIFDRIKAYFVYNKITKEKLEYFDKYIPFFKTSSLKNNLLEKMQKY